MIPALWYAARLNWPVLPLVAGGKVPLTSHGVNEATTDPSVIREWWHRWPRANVGIRCASFIVIDLDTREDGPAKFERLQGSRQLPDTPRATTATGGVHLLFEPPPFEVVGKITAGVDVLLGGRYIVAAPSTRPEGRYTWERWPHHCPLAPLPQWLAELVMRREPVAPATSRYVAESDRVKRARAYAARLPPAISGSGGHATTMRAAVLVVRGFALDDSSALDVLREWNASCCPPWSERELRRKIHEARRVGRVPVGALLENAA